MKTYKFDTKNVPLGRAATGVAAAVLGKNEVDFMPNRVADVLVEVENVNEIEISEKKRIHNKVYRHSGYIGNLKTLTVQQQIDKVGMQQHYIDTVKKMLPDNRLRRARLNRIKFK